MTAHTTRTIRTALVNFNYAEAALIAGMAFSSILCLVGFVAHLIQLSNR